MDARSGCCVSQPRVIAENYPHQIGQPLRPENLQGFQKAQMVLLLESAGDPAGLAAPLQDTVRGLDPDLPTFGTRTLQRTFKTGAIDPNLLIVQLSAAMGSMGVLLALTGLYGLMAYSVSTRRREIGIRLAIGAHKSHVLGMVLRQGLVLAGTGTVIGLFLSAARLLAAAFPSYQYSVVVYLIVVPAAFGITMLAASCRLAELRWWIQY